MSPEDVFMEALDEYIGLRLRSTTVEGRLYATVTKEDIERSRASLASLVASIYERLP